MNRIKVRQMLWLWGAIMLALITDNPAVALLFGAAIALIWGNKDLKFTGMIGKYSLQTAVVLLGFGLQIGTVLHVGLTSVWVTLISVTFVMIMGWLLGLWLKVDKDISTLISGGTAICGGSAIAALAPAIGASQAHTAVAMAIVFLLNAVGLIIFPYVGQLLGLTQSEFGLWSAIAIHDTSSVVGAAAIYGTLALSIATTVKLTRALWILPLSFVMARVHHSKSAAKIPWFLFGFLLAAVIRSVFEGAEGAWNSFAALGKHLMVATLFFIGAGLTREDLRQIGSRPLIKGVVLWAIVTVVSLVAIYAGWIHIDVPL
ncbi:MAG TPA: putative sulfate exporter family transporter [Ignavibacteriales bacterium]|nr:putative sulfate exporter family transporter [Ignavibacteriales bacterium]